MRHWFLTWTTFGTWLPGDDRGFVSHVRDGEGSLVRHNEPRTECDRAQRGLQLSAREQMKGPPILLNLAQARIVVRQFQETSKYRGRELFGVAVMSNHIHVLVGVSDDADPSLVMGDYKSYASRALNKVYGKPPSETWWTVDGSKRKKTGEAIEACLNYIRNQAHPLVIWIAGEGYLVGDQDQGEPGA